MLGDQREIDMLKSASNWLGLGWKISPMSVFFYHGLSYPTVVLSLVIVVSSECEYCPALRYSSQCM